MKIALVALVACLSLASCSADVDVPGIESEIGGEVEAQTDVPVSVKCPETVEWKVGQSFTCAVDADDGSESTEATVEMQEDGAYDWELTD